MCGGCERETNIAHLSFLIDSFTSLLFFLGFFNKMLSAGIFFGVVLVAFCLCLLTCHMTSFQHVYTHLYDMDMDGSERVP